MELIKRDLPKDYRLLVVSDLHVGSQLFKEHLFQKYVVQPLIDNDDLYAVLNGDLIEGKEARRQDQVECNSRGLYDSTISRGGENNV